METDKSILPDNKVKIKISKCPKCKGIVRAAAEHMMTKENTKEFYKECIKHNLGIDIVSLKKYRSMTNYCECDIKNKNNIGDESPF